MTCNKGSQLALNQRNCSSMLCVLTPRQSGCSINKKTNTHSEIFHGISENLDLLVAQQEKSLGFILWAPWIFVPNVMAIHKMVVEIFQ